MSLIIPSQYARQKPLPGAQVNPDHPLAAGLVMAVLFNEGGSAISTNLPSVPRDLFGYKLVPTAGASAYPSWTTGRSGPAARYVPNGGLYANTTFPGNAVSKACTIITIARPRNSSDTASLFGNHTGTSDRVQAHFPFSATFYWDYGNGFINNISRVSFTPAASFFNVWHHMVYHGGGSIPLAIWADGIKQVQGTSATTVNLSGNGMDLGSWTGSANTADMELFLVYNRVLTPQEIAWSNAAPYAFLTPAATPTKRFFLMGTNQVSVHQTAVINVEAASVFVNQQAAITLESRAGVADANAATLEALAHASMTAPAALEAANQPLPQAVLKLEARGLVASTTHEQLESRIAAVRTASVAVESITDQQAATLALETTHRVVQVGVLSVEANMLNVHVPRVIVLEYLRQPLPAARVPLEARHLVAQPSALNLEDTGNRLTQAAILRLEVQFRRAVTAAVRLEARGPVSDALDIPLESTGNHVAQTATANVETISGFYPLQLKIESKIAVVQTASMFLEMRGLEFNVAQQGVINYDTYYGIQSYSPTPRWYFESLQPLSITQQVVVENLHVTVTATTALVLEALRQPLPKAALRLEIRPHDITPVTAGLRIEARFGIGVHRPLLLEASGDTRVGSKAGIEARGIVAPARALPLESRMRVAVTAALRLEIEAIRATVQAGINLEARGHIVPALAHISLEAREPGGLLPPSAVGTLVIERSAEGTLIVHEALPLSES